MACPASRFDRLVASMGGDEAFEKIVRPKIEGPDEVVEEIEQTEVVAETGQADDLWKEQPPSEPDLEESDIEALREQQRFLETHGYNWWKPPRDMLPKYRPRPEKKVVTPLTVDGNVDVTLDPRHGDQAPEDMKKFTPFAGICKFPYKFVSRGLMQPLATAFFDQGQIQERDWDLYYIYTELETSFKPTIFVLEHQFQELLDEINHSFPSANLSITPDFRDEGLVIDFSDITHADLRPRWLGHSTSRAQAEIWPSSLKQTKVSDSAMSDKNVKLFKEKVELANEAGRTKKKGARKAKLAENVVKRQAMSKDLLQAQRYLGLLAAAEDSLMPDISNLTISAVDSTKPAPHPFDKEPIFIAIDVEAFERPPNQITEVGVATLDTRDLKGVAPEKYGKVWQGAIRARHFRIAEYKHLVNKDFVIGCPDKFEFGTSEFVGKDKIGSKLTSCFHAPFSATHIIEKDMLATSYETDFPKYDTDASKNGAKSEETRNIILLGHGITNDIKYLRQLGFDPLNRGNLLATMDTQPMYQAHSYDPSPAGLGKVIDAFDFTGWNPHNAGNDAVHTIWALLGMTVAAATERGSPEASQRREEAQTRREKAAAEEAVSKVRDGAEGWDLEEGGAKLGGGGERGEKEAKGFKPFTGSESGLYPPNGYPLDV